MKQFIREHPWRLEIVPLILAILEFVIVIIYLSKGIELSDRTNRFVYMMNVFLAIVLPWRSIQQNHDWVSAERWKRFNYGAPVLVGFMSVGVWLFGFAFLADMPYAWPIIPLSIIAESLLEYSRKHVPHEERHRISRQVQTVQPGERFYYREFNAPNMREIVIAVLVIIVLFYFLELNIWQSVAIGLIGLSISLISMTTLSISNEAIILRFWTFRDGMM